MKRRKHLLIIEPSLILRKGIITILRKIHDLEIDIAEDNSPENILEILSQQSPDILVINPNSLWNTSLQQVKTHHPDLKIIAFYHGLVEDQVLKQFDACISIYTTTSTIKDQIQGLIAEPLTSEPDKQEISVREKEVIALVAKGYSNKQIADQLSLSTHTVMTHRRNIASKLQIHSPAGLTIYAIVNKIIDMNEVK